MTSTTGGPPPWGAPAQAAPHSVAVEPDGGAYRVTPLDRDGHVLAGRRVSAGELPAVVRQLEIGAPRWVWDTNRVYAPLLAAGVRVERAHDLRLCRAILRRSAGSAAHLASVPTDGWDAGSAARSAGTLFDVDGPAEADGVVHEFERQRDAAAAAERPGALRLLLAAESAGALAAAEMRHAGLPWRADEHERILTEHLGPRVPYGQRPEVLERLLGEIRRALGAPTLNPDSPAELVKALRGAGLAAESTRSSELRRFDHPAVAPLLEYKKLARLLAANGWHWLDTWVVGGRFAPDYLVGGVVTGRWATRGGGAMQLPKQIRGAVVADDGWTFVVADAAQLEPRVLAGMARDSVMAEAGRGRDLYDGIVATGAVPDRPSAKYGMLGALYGATQGTGGRLVPRLAQRFPRALGLVEAAARTGERGGTVRTLLGRSSPEPAESWREAQAAASRIDATEIQIRRARSSARDQGRFTRNFVVQGTAAEWALCWMADLRKRLWALGDGPLEQRPHLVYFLHDEVLVHTPARLAPEAEQAVRQAAATAGRLLFGSFPVDFPLDVSVVRRYSDAG